MVGHGRRAGRRRRRRGSRPGRRWSWPTRGLRRVPSVPERPARRCASRRARTELLRRHRRVRRATSTSTRRDCCRFRGHCRCGRPRSPSRSRSQCTRGRSRGSRPDDRVLVTGAGPVGSAHDRGAARRPASTTSPSSEPAPARRERAAALGATVVTPDALPAAPMGRPVDEPYTARVRVLGPRRRVRGRARPTRPGRHASSSSAPARSRRASTTTA